MSTTVGSGARISLSCMKSLCMSYVPRNQKYKNNLTLQGCGLITSNAGLRISHFKEWTQEIIWRYIYIHLHTFTICRCLNHLDFSCLIFSYFFIPVTNEHFVETPMSPSCCTSSICCWSFCACLLIPLSVWVDASNMADTVGSSGKPLLPAATTLEDVAIFELGCRIVKSEI